MLSANTAWLEPNTTVKPLNDPVFRRALAMAINVNQIVAQDYRNLVLPANPTGLLPTWSKYVNKAAVKKYGFKYSAAAAKKLLPEARVQAGRRLLQEQGRLDDQPRHLGAAGLVGLGDRPRHDRLVREGGRDPDPRRR